MSELFPEETALSVEASALAVSSLLAEVPWPLALTDANGRILALSKPLLLLLGVPAAALIQRPFESLFLDPERVRLRTLSDPKARRGAREPLKTYLHLTGRLPVAVEIEVVPIPEDGAGRLAINVYPLSRPHRRERLILECNLLASSLLTAQSDEEVYQRAALSLRPLGIGMLVCALDADGAALHINYTSISTTIVSLLRQTANVDFSKLHIPATAPFFADVLAQWEPLYIANYTSLLDTVLPPTAAAICRNLMRLIGIPSSIMAPFRAGDQSRQVLMVWSQVLGQDEVPFIGAFALQIGAIMTQIALRRQMETQMQRLRSLATTARAVTHLGSLDEVLRVICVQAQELLGARFARIAAPIPGTPFIQYIMSTGYEATNVLDMSIPIDASVSGAVLRSGVGRVVADMQLEPDVYAPVKTLSSARSVLYQPLTHHGVALGVLIVGHTEVGYFQQADLEYLGHYAEYAAVAMANAQLHNALQLSEREQQRQRRELAALLDLSTAVNQPFDLDALLHEGLRVLEAIDLATVATVMLVNSTKNALTLHATFGVPASVLPVIQDVPLDSISGDVLREGQLRVLSESERQQMLAQYGITQYFQQHSSVYVPLVVGDKRLGVLGVSRPDTRPYAERELWLLQALGNQLAQATSRAQARLALEETAALNERLYHDAEEVRSYLNTLVHNTPDLLLTIRPDMTIHLLNPERASAEDAHYPALVEGQSFLTIVPAERRADLLARWHRILDGQPQSIELDGIAPDGQPFHLLLSAALIAAYGEVFMIVKDVTEQRNNEAQALQNEKLAALGRMVAGAAHELNNPLAAILGLTQLQLVGELGQELRADLEQIERSALRARSIVQQMLSFARAQRPEPQAVPIGALVRDTLERLAGVIAQEHVQVAVDLAPDLPAASGDPGQLEQVLFNIVHNALQALAGNPAGAQRSLRIQARQQDSMLQLSIADSGPGIPPEHLSQIFDPFFTTRKVGQGTGLGLAITHAIVQQHQGRIWVTSQLDQPTTFTLSLPIAIAAPSAPAVAAPVMPPAGGQRILLVEDEAMVRAVVSRTLTRKQYQVDAVASGEDALVQALAHDYALVISDLQMPGMDGPALYERLREERPALRWLIMTGDTMGERSRAFLERSRLPALPKPFTQEQLLTRVAECIKG